MKFQYDDGGRQQAGYKGKTGDCVVRAIAIAAGLPYQMVYDLIGNYASYEHITKRHLTKSSARTGVRKSTSKRILEKLGWSWTPTMHIGSGCTVHLRSEELPQGRLIVTVSRHWTAVIDGVIHDIYDPSRNGARCVYGYWSKP